MTESWGVAFLGVIAFASLVQAGFLIALAVAGARLAKRLDAMQDRLDREIRPAMDNLARISRNFAEVTDLVTLQARRIDDLLADTIEKIEDATNTIRRVVVRPLGPLADLTAFLKGIRRGVEVYYKLRGLESRHRPPPRRVTDEDEHLFI
ncbi:MAG TPA: hypothetical protein VIC87_10040 [Vicinamibacteria bacterium]